MFIVLLVALFVIVIALVTGKALEHVDRKRDQVERSYKNYKNILMKRCKAIHEKRDQLGRVFDMNKEELEAIDDGCDKITFLRLTRKKLTRIDDSITYHLQHVMDQQDPQGKVQKDLYHLIEDYESELTDARQNYVVAAEGFNESIKTSPLRFFKSLFDLKEYEDHYEFHHIS